MLNKKKRIHIEKFAGSSGAVYNVWADKEDIPLLKKYGTVEGRGPDYAFHVDPRFDAEEVIARLESLNSKLMTITHTNANTRCISFTADPDIAAEFGKLEYGTMVSIGYAHDLYVSHSMSFCDTVESLKAGADLVNSAGSVEDAVRDLRTCHAAADIAMFLWDLIG